MKFNKWTLGLAAVGAVSLASAVNADEAKLIPLQTALSNTTISGYVDTAVQYTPGDQPGVAPAGTSGAKIDSFSLNDVDIAIDHPLDSTPWAAGYHVDFNLGTDAVGWGTTATGNAGTAVRQAYIALSTPVGNGIQWKMGVQDDIIGYEGNTDGNNPNYTRSVGYSLEPTTLLGLIGTYQINSIITVQGGVAESTLPDFYAGEAAPTLSDKTIAAAVAFTAPDSWGFLKGGTLNLGALINPYKAGVYNYYAGLTIPTPISALKLGAAFDLVSFNDEFAGNPKNDSGFVVGLYGNYQATDKLAFNLRGEFFDLKGQLDDGEFSTPNPYAGLGNGVGEELTATIQYNLWANVTSRAEFRWDHSDSGSTFGLNAGDVNNYILALNVIYSF